MAKTLFSVELESNSWCDDTLNGTLDECKSYIKEEYPELNQGTEVRIAEILLDERGCVIETLDIIEEW